LKGWGFWCVQRTAGGFDHPPLVFLDVGGPEADEATSADPAMA
jgi:hypothetical protein